MNLSRYVVETWNPLRQRVWFNTVTRKELPTSSTIEELREHFFLSGQEEEAVHHELFDKPFDTLNLLIASSWECNLRCTHCIMGHRLVEHNPAEIDILGVENLVRQYIQKHELQILSMQFYGGETLLELSRFAPIVDRLSLLQGVQTTFSVFTNLSMHLTEEHIKMLSRFTSIGVSVDGLEKEHNLQRIPKNGLGDFNPFQSTINNLKLLVRAGLKERIEVQACLQDEFNTPEYRKSFYRFIVQFGISPNRIKVGTLAPSKIKPEPQEMYLKGLRLPKLINTYCCKYKPSVLLVDYYGNVYSDYYTYTRLGSIYDDPSVIEKNQKQLVLDTMPAFQDPKCRACNVLGYCWGGCSIHEMHAPLSKYCDQTAIQQMLDEFVQKGTLI